MELLGYTGYLPLIIDAILVIIFLITMISMAKKGLFKSVYRLSSAIITIVLVMVLIEPVSGALEESQAGAMIYRSISQQMTKQSDGVNSGKIEGIDAEAVWDMPEYIKVSSEIVQVRDSAMSVATHSITGIIIKIIAAVGLFVIIRLMLALIFLFLEGVVKLPVLRGVNSLAGILAAIVSVGISVYLICAVISLDAALFDGLKVVIADTKVVRFFYDYNILMSMFI